MNYVLGSVVVLLVLYLPFHDLSQGTYIATTLVDEFMVRALLLL